ncbi:hypothetical protein [Micromonospora sp. NBC_01813]|uniref:hypothetical protein n=1 Tax=Micromonospora sp. NBC_01813 TaxID=2975988 RepID=UPI002DDB32D2|nr:hypothetical protein [Micromonospora sp. NBC_01813]WSA12026.1 hypothetical protein OG958_15300 [Micromonospora sp. NBC_01813]
MRTELDVTLSGSNGGMDARQALVRLEEVLDLLADLEDADRRRPVGQRRVPRSTWTFARLGLGSVRAALAPLEPGPGATYDELDALNVRAVDGFEQVEGAELLPDGWGVNAARTARRLAGRLGATPDTGMRLSLIVDGQVSKTVAVTRRASVNLDRALKVRRESIGSVSGSIDSMSVRTKPSLVSGRPVEKAGSELICRRSSSKPRSRYSGTTLRSVVGSSATRLARSWG